MIGTGKGHLSGCKHHLICAQNDSWDRSVAHIWVHAQLKTSVCPELHGILLLSNCTHLHFFRPRSNRVRLTAPLVHTAGRPNAQGHAEVQVAAMSDLPVDPRISVFLKTYWDLNKAAIPAPYDSNRRVSSHYFSAKTVIF